MQSGKPTDTPESCLSSAPAPNPALRAKPHLAIQEQVVQHRGLHWTVELHLSTQTTQSRSTKKGSWENPKRWRKISLKIVINFPVNF